MKLFEVCRHRGIPIITVINKWDRPGNDALDLMDEISDAHRPAADPAELAGRHRRRLPRRPGRRHRRLPALHPHRRRRHRRPRGAPGRRRGRSPWRATPSCRPRRRASCSPRPAPEHDVDSFLAGRSTPVLFGSAVLNFGVRYLLDTLVDLAPPPGPRPDAVGCSRARSTRRSAPSCSRCRRAWTSPTATGSPSCGSAPGVFERGMVVTHATTNRPFATKYAQQVFGRERDEHRPGLPRRRRRPGQRHRPAGRRHPVRRRAGHLPADPVLLARALRRGAGQGLQPLQAVPSRHRAARPGGRRAGAALGPARRPGAGAGRGRPDAVRGRRAPDGQRVRRPGDPGAARLLPGPRAPTTRPRRS